MQSETPKLAQHYRYSHYADIYLRRCLQLRVNVARPISKSSSATGKWESRTLHKFYTKLDVVVQ